MKKIVLVVICCLLLATGCMNNSNSHDRNNKETNNSTIKNNDNKESDLKVSDVKITIHDITYTLKLEDNNTVEEFVHILPQEFTMSELNGNEKYVYMDNALTTNSFNPKHIEKGDVMLYGDNCLVIFYKSFDTSFSYTKIGHINNLNDLGNGNVKVKIEL